MLPTSSQQQSEMLPDKSGSKSVSGSHLRLKEEQNLRGHSFLTELSREIYGSCIISAAALLLLLQAPLTSTRFCLHIWKSDFIQPVCCFLSQILSADESIVFKGSGRTRAQCLCLTGQSPPKRHGNAPHFSGSLDCVLK